MLSFGLTLNFNSNTGRVEDASSSLYCDGKWARLFGEEESMRVPPLACVRLALFCAFLDPKNWRAACRYFEFNRKVDEFWVMAWDAVLPSVSPPVLFGTLIDSVVYPPVRHFVHEIVCRLMTVCDLRGVEASIKEAVSTPLCITSDGMHRNVADALSRARIEPRKMGPNVGICALQYSCCGAVLSYVDHVLLVTVLALSDISGELPVQIHKIRADLKNLCGEKKYTMRYIFNRWRQVRTEQ